MNILLKRGANPQTKVRASLRTFQVLFTDPRTQDLDEFTAKELAEIAGHTDIAALLSGTQNASP